MNKRKVIKRKATPIKRKVVKKACHGCNSLFVIAMLMVGMVGVGLLQGCNTINATDINATDINATYVDDYTCIESGDTTTCKSAKEWVRYNRDGME